MKNKKGFTSIELVVSFVIVSAIVIGLFDVILNYQNKQQISSYESSINAYINEMTKLLEDDFIMRKLESVTITSTSSATFTYANQKDGSTTSQLFVQIADGAIRYGKTGELLRYSIPKIPDLKISSCTLQIQNQFFLLEIIFTHPNFQVDKKLKIAAPIQYRA